MFNFEEELKKLPNAPGVYLMHDAGDTIIYVGKAVNLHSRVRSYFRKIVGRGPQIDRMVEQITRFEYIVTDSELEALVLENNLIKEYSPKYNTMLKDDKTYPYIKVTMGEEYPRILFSREMKKDRSKYFGPYTGGGKGYDRPDEQALSVKDLQSETAAGYRSGTALPELPYQAVSCALSGICQQGGVPGARGAGVGFPEWQL